LFLKALEAFFFTSHATFSLRAKVFNQAALLAVMSKQLILLFNLLEAFFMILKPDIFEN